MDKYQESLKILKKKIKENKELTEEEWDSYAQENALFSSFTIQAHRDVLSWKGLKENLKKRDKKLKQRIERKKKELDKMVEKTGLHSEATKKINDEVNDLITCYYEENQIKKREKTYSKENLMYKTYKKSMEEIEKEVKQTDIFPNTRQWNQLAQKKNLLSNISIEYIAGLGWNEIRQEILKHVRKIRKQERKKVKFVEN